MTGRSDASTGYVGRQAELAALDDLRRGLARSRGVTVLVGGDAGIGKTRLLAEFERSLPGGRARTLVRAECRDTIAETLGPVLAIASALASSLADADVSDEARRALGMLFPDRLAPDESAPELPQSRLFAGTTDLLRAAAAKRAVLVLIEDLHWADAASLEWLAFVTPRLAGTRVMIVGTYRLEHLESHDALLSVVGRLERCENASVVRLRPLADDDIATLVRGACDANRLIADDAVARIARRAEGNPFFAEELLKNEQTIGGPTSRSLPISVRASILERLRLFSATDREIIALAAAFGSRFDVADLVDVSGLPSHEVARAMQRARQLNVVVADGAEGHMRFRHGLTRQTIYDDVLAADTRALHARVLERLESRRGVESDASELAYHASRAGLAEKALAYDERAGDRAISVRAYVDACAAFERALAAAGDDGDRARLLERLGYASELGGRFDAAVAHCSRALDLRIARGDADDAVRVFTRVVGCRSNGGDESAFDDVEPFADRFADRASPAALGGLLALGARMASARDDLDEARRLLGRIADPAVLAPRSRINYFITELNDRAAAVDLAGWQRTAATIELVAAQLPVDLAAIALCTVAQTAIYLGLGDRADAVLDRADSLIREGGSFGIETFREAIAAIAALTRGRLAPAARHLRAAYARPEVFVAQTLAAQAGPAIAAHLGDASLAASPVGERVLRIAREGRVNSDEALVLAVYAEQLARLGRVVEARGEIAVAMTAADRPHPQMDCVFVIAAEHGDERALDELERLVERRAAMPSPLRIAHLELTRALIARRRGDDAGARAFAGRAADGYRFVGWPLSEAKSLALAGRVSEADLLLERCGSRLGRSTASDARGDANAGPLSIAKLSPREGAVAHLVSEGLTNAAIAELLHVSPKTIEKYLSSVYGKLDIRSRAQLAAFVSRQAPATESPASVAN